jgi:hypothetical protein
MNDISTLSNLNSLHIGTILFAIVLAIFWIHTFFIEYHLIRFGIGRIPKQLSLLTMVGSLVMSIVAAVAFFNLGV